MHTRTHTGLQTYADRPIDTDAYIPTYVWAHIPEHTRTRMQVKAQAIICAPACLRLRRNETKASWGHASHARTKLASRAAYDATLSLPPQTTGALQRSLSFNRKCLEAPTGPQLY